MELADLLLTVFLVGCPVGLMVAFIWKFYRRGVEATQRAARAALRQVNG